MLWNCDVDRGIWKSCEGRGFEFYEILRIVFEGFLFFFPKFNISMPRIFHKRELLTILNFYAYKFIQREFSFVILILPTPSRSGVRSEIREARSIFMRQSLPTHFLSSFIGLKYWRTHLDNASTPNFDFEVGGKLCRRFHRSLTTGEKSKFNLPSFRTWTRATGRVL